jgi:hypothetical protein
MAAPKSPPSDGSQAVLDEPEPLVDVPLELLPDVPVEDVLVPTVPEPPTPPLVIPISLTGAAVLAHALAAQETISNALSSRMAEG